jgi:hypothetical protein
MPGALCWFYFAWAHIFILYCIEGYQKDAVTNYLRENPPPFPADVFNSTGKVRPLGSTAGGECVLMP